MTNIDVGNEEIVITDTPKESLDIANIEDDLRCEDDPFESNPTKLNVVFSPPILIYKEECVSVTPKLVSRFVC